MKREFLQGLKVGETPLPKEVIDAIMAENGRDIETVKAHYADYDALKQAEADGAKQWQQKLDQQVDNHRREMSELIFSHNLEKAILAAKGRNAKAITALLDIDTLKASENQTADLEQALKNLKIDCSYLFQTETPPPYARGTGEMTPDTNRSPATLAGALLEKFERK